MSGTSAGWDVTGYEYHRNKRCDAAIPSPLPAGRGDGAFSASNCFYSTSLWFRTSEPPCDPRASLAGCLCSAIMSAPNCSAILSALLPMKRRTDAPDARGRTPLARTQPARGEQITTAQAAEPVVLSPRQIRRLRGMLRQADRVVRVRAPTRFSASIGPGGSTSPASSWPPPGCLRTPGICRRGSVGEVSVSLTPAFGADILADQLGGHYR